MASKPSILLVQTYYYDRLYTGRQLAELTLGHLGHDF